MHVETPLTPLIKSKNNNKTDKYFVNFFKRDPTSGNLDLNKFKMTLFDNGEPGEFLLFIHNFNMTLKASGTLKSDVKIKYLCVLVRG